MATSKELELKISLLKNQAAVIGEDLKKLEADVARVRDQEYEAEINREAKALLDVCQVRTGQPHSWRVSQYETVIGPCDGSRHLVRSSSTVRMHCFCGISIELKTR